MNEKVKETMTHRVTHDPHVNTLREDRSTASQGWSQRQQRQYRKSKFSAADVEPENSPIIQAAWELHAIGLNPVPQPYGQKDGFPWKESKFIRLWPNDIPQVF